jgi:hypothetical protein
VKDLLFHTVERCSAFLFGSTRISVEFGLSLPCPGSPLLAGHAQVKQQNRSDPPFRTDRNKCANGRRHTALLTLLAGGGSSRPIT